MPPLTDDRPAVTDWLASVQGAPLAEGRLELKCIAENHLLGTLVTEELVISGQEQKIRIVLPPLNWSPNAVEIDVHLRWLGKDRAWNLPTQRLRTALRSARKFPVLIGETPQRPRAARKRDPLADRLRFELLLPEELQDRAITIIHHQAAPGFPQDPLAFCQYEVIAIADDVFPALRAAQLDAMIQWVRAGGSLYLEPEGVLEPYHVAALNRLVQDERDRPAFVTDEKGRLPLTTLPDGEGVFIGCCGLGTVVLHLADEKAEISVERWKDVAAWLWKFRGIFADMIRGDGLTLEVAVAQLRPNQDSDVYLERGPPLDEIMDAIRPAGVKLVPVWVIGTLLGVLVLVIGPLDYLVLSSLRRRKWTWITFPACIVLMTGVVVALTNYYLSSSEARRALILHDVADDGEIVRTNRFELVFASATRQLETDMQSALFAPLKKGGAVVDDNFRLNQRQRAQLQSLNYNQGMIYSQSLVAQMELEATDPVNVAGRVPGRYSVSQHVNQWTPQLNRKLSIGPTAQAKPVDWDALQIPPFPNVGFLKKYGETSNLSPLTSRLIEQFGPTAQAMALPAEGVVWKTMPNTQWQPILQRLTLAERPDVAKLLSQTSPHGGRTLDDVTLGACCAANRWWLFVIVPQGDEVLVYRRSYAYSD